MGCVSSKGAVPLTPDDNGGRGRRSSKGAGVLAGSLLKSANADHGGELGERGKALGLVAGSPRSVRLGNLYRYIEGEQIAAGWPAWLTNAAREAIYGWVPLKAESYEKLEKIGQGTYSSVFKARDLDTGRIVALKKVRFDNFEPESVRFMAREIVILRKLNHPNIMKLEGIITARLSSSLYLVFEYMEHDLAGLSSSPDIKFTESQVKCYMQQLLSALEHCHSHGVMHRDLKCSNLLVNNQGILKMADFGLANFYKPGSNQPLTSRVVTLWYRPPELLLGSTNYEETVDLWSVGCVFAELFLGKPVLRGRTEVEQIHKIFKLCGCPPDEYWKNTQLSHSAVFKPHQQYSNGLRETFNFLPESVIKMLETFLSLEPSKRGTAKSALSSEFFKTKPYACAPSNMPKYSPHKEIDAKSREEAYRRRNAGRERTSEVSQRLLRMKSTGKLNGPIKLAAGAQGPWIRPHNDTKKDSCRENAENRLFVDLKPMPSITLSKEDQCPKNRAISGPLSSSNAGRLVQAMKSKENHSSGALDDSSVLELKDLLESKRRTNRNSKDKEDDKKPCKLEGNAMPMKHRKNNDYRVHSERVAFSGQLLTEPAKVDELLEKLEHHMRRAVRKSCFQRVRGR